MSVCPADVEALKRPEVMAAVLDRYATPRGMVNGKARWTCPLHTHRHPEKPHLRVESGRDGGAVAICDSYGVIGDVFALVHQLDGVQGFRAQVEAVACVVGYRLADEGVACAREDGRRGRIRPGVLHAVKSHGAGRDGADGGRGLAAQAPAGSLSGVSVSPAESTLPEYLPPKEERAALQAVERLATRPDAMARYAALLGLPMEAVQAHTDGDAAALGLLGLDEAGRLVYVYTARDAEGAWRVPMYKVRALPGEKPRFRAHGRKAGLWGAEAIEGHDMVLVTEGESDALAVRAAVWAWLDAWSKDEPETYPRAGAWPVVVAKPDAGTFRATWAAALVHKEVVLIADADEAGKTGARRTAEVLQAAGARRVCIWSPSSAGCKDARAALDPARPWLLAEEIMSHKLLQL